MTRKSWCSLLVGRRVAPLRGLRAHGKRWRSEYGDTVILAEFEVFHSRPVAPTRRVAVSGGRLPVEPAPGFGGLLLAGIVASYVEHLDDETRDDLDMLMTKVTNGSNISQPQLRHRLQVDRVGLSHSTHALHGDGETLRFEFPSDAPPAPQILAAVYRTGQFDVSTRRSVMMLLRSAAGWAGGSSDDLVLWLTGHDQAGVYSMSQADPLLWALDVFGLRPETVSRREIQRRFRRLLRAAHPDHGGHTMDAADAIGRITEARRILLATAS